ncbi:unnamed protein product [Tuber aestivum]|uniref:Uncharacterized protein n=1 Tax=Tuber aestivum TaxID=59557 RepID=A0A292Q2A0_9PEZI|nr:unnamed protein product [Tuber aestivum]
MSTVIHPTQLVPSSRKRALQGEAIKGSIFRVSHRYCTRVQYECFCSTMPLQGTLSGVGKGEAGSATRKASGTGMVTQHGGTLGMQAQWRREETVLEIRCR